MKRFRFPLERVRCWRAEQASAEELKLEQLRAELDRLARERRRVEMEALQASAEVLARPSLDALELTSLDAYRLHLRQCVREIDYRRAQRTQRRAAPARYRSAAPGRAARPAARPGLQGMVGRERQRTRDPGSGSVPGEGRSRAPLATG